MTNKEKDVFSEFESELVSWSKDGKIPRTCDQDTKYFLALQNARLQKKNVTLRYKLKSRGGAVDQIRGRSWADRKYTNTMCFQGYDKELKVWQKEKCLFSKRDSENLYGIVTSLHDLDVTGEETYICPNCGAISSINELLDGCRYCGTHFTMTDLFPKITNYFFLHDYAMGKTDIKKKIIPSLIGGLIFGLLIGVLAFVGMNALTDMSNISADKQLVTRLSFLLIGGMIGLGTGVISVPIGILASAIWDSIKISPILGKIAGTKDKIKRILEKYDPYFSYDYFVSQIVAATKTMVFADKKDDLTIYQGNGNVADCSDIIDVEYRGGIACSNAKIEGDYCTLDVEVFTKNVCLVDNKVCEKNESFVMKVMKNISRPTELGFSIRKVQCPNCAASFDATHIQHCPSCSSKYDLKDDSWVVLDFKRKQN